MNRPEPINFLTRPDLMALKSNDMLLLFMFKSIVMDYPRLTDLIDKSATSLFILHAEDAITIENSEIKKDFMFVKDFFLNKYAADVSKDLLNAMQNPVIIKIQYEKMADAFNSL
nr:MAG TPA: hypothetical protein [Caudoviricetes sp.]